MEELNINNETKKEEYDFYSTVVMGEKEHIDFNNVTYSRIAIFILVFLIFSIISTVQQLLVCQNTSVSLIYTSWMMFLMGFLFFFTQKRIKDTYKRILFSKGENCIIYKVCFGEKIVAETNQHAPVEYDYSVITSVKETSQFYLLKMKYNLYCILQKDIKGNLENVDFIEYIFKKCPNIKNKKIKKMMNKKKECIIYLCAFAVLFLFNLICFFI